MSSLKRAAAAPFSVMGQATISEVQPDEFESPEVRDVYAVWNERRGEHAMPTRQDVLPRPLSRLLRNISLVKVLADGDYEFRIIGDAHVEAYGTNSQGTRFSDVIARAPEFGTILKQSYDLVRARRAPAGFRGFMRREVTQARFDWLETLYMPLRDEAGAVEYILNVTVYRPRDGMWPGKQVLG